MSTRRVVVLGGEAVHPQVTVRQLIHGAEQIDCRGESFGVAAESASLDPSHLRR